jgi:RNA polymerase sigma factor (sigma-70 family)
MPQVRAGDPEALEQWVVALYPVVRRALARRLPRATQADLDDATQAGMARIAARARQCTASHDRGVVAWACTVAWHAALEDLRSGAVRVARRSLPFDAPLRGPGPNVPPAETIAAPWDASVVDDETDADELARRAVVALDALPPPIGVLFWMRLVEDATWPDIGRALGTSTSAVKRRFQRAQATLRRLLARPDRP